MFLGVACEVYREETGNGEWERRDGNLQFISKNDILPRAVVNWFGFKDYNPMLQECTATNWNDDAKASFQEIADLFEKEFLS